MHNIHRCNCAIAAHFQMLCPYSTLCSLHFADFGALEEGFLLAGKNSLAFLSRFLFLFPLPISKHHTYPCIFAKDCMAGGDGKNLPSKEMVCCCLPVLLSFLWSPWQCMLPWYIPQEV